MAGMGSCQPGGTVLCMLRHAVRVVTLRAIDVRVDPSLAIVAVLIAWTMAARFATAHGTAVGWVMAIAATVAFFASILAHELGHAFEARHRGIRVEAVTLFLFGGVTEMASHSHRPRDEFAIAAVGPWISLVCGAVFGLVAAGATGLPAWLGRPLGDVAGLLGWLNVALAVFNIIPGAPLDGGRVLRAALWWMLGNRHRAIRITAGIGQALGAALVAFGVWVYLSTPAGLFASLWYWVIGAFLIHAARGESRWAKADEIYTRWTVGKAFAPSISRDDQFSLASTVDLSALPRVASNDDLHRLVEAFQGEHDVVVVERSDGSLGVLTERQVATALAELRRRNRREALSTEAPPRGGG